MLYRVFRRRHVLYDGRLPLFSAAHPGYTGEVPRAVGLTGVEIEAAHADVGHVVHVKAVEVLPSQADGGAVAAKSHRHSGGVAAQVPQRLADAVLQGIGQTVIRRERMCGGLA